MIAPNYPFTALVGLDRLKLALQLAAIDRRLSVVLRGDKGSGKSTAARGLAALLDTTAPFVTLPIGATEDRLLGGLDVEKALKGEPVLKRGLLAEANGGVLYIDEVNLLADHLADALLDAAASGVHVVEREGFSATQPADFVLLGSMNPEEGALRPQLLDRFALAADVETLLDPVVRCEVLERRLAYDRDPASFHRGWTTAQAALAAALAAARSRLAAIEMSGELLRHVAERVVAHGVRSVRADLAVARASRACAALEGARTVTVDHVEAVVPLALAHRVDHRSPRPPSPPPAGPKERAGTTDESALGQSPAGSPPPERVFQAIPAQSPRLTLELPRDRIGSAPERSALATGPVIATRRSDTPQAIDLRPTLMHAVVHHQTATITVADLHEPVREPRAATRFILVVDSSGSHAIQERMRLVKGAASGLLDASHRRHDEVVVIACRGSAAQVLVEPTSSRDDAARVLEYLPTGGRTPLAHALELAAGYVTDHAVTVVITDGHANVATRGTDAWSDALAAAASLGCPALVIDTEDPGRATGRPQRLAEAMRANCVGLDQIGQADVVRVIRERS